MASTSQARSSKAAVSIIGSGNMGRAIGVCVSRAGYPVFFAGRNPSDAPKRAAALATAAPASGAGADKTSVHYGSIVDGASFGDVLVWTSRETAVEKVLGAEGVSNLQAKTAGPDGKPVVVLDCNNWDFQNVLGAGIGATLDKVGPGELLQKGFEEQGIRAAVFKAFNTLPMEVFALDRTELANQGVQVFLASILETTPDLKKTCVDLISAAGFQLVDLGAGAQSARMAEMIADVVRFCLLRGAGDGGWSHISIRTVPRVDLSVIGERSAGYQ